MGKLEQKIEALEKTLWESGDGNAEGETRSQNRQWFLEPAIEEMKEARARRDSAAFAVAKKKHDDALKIDQKLERQAKRAKLEHTRLTNLRDRIWMLEYEELSQLRQWILEPEQDRLAQATRQKDAAAIASSQKNIAAAKKREQEILAEVKKLRSQI